MIDPTVSIIIPVYNTSKWLPDCLDSVIRQNYDDLQIICVNDGSNDNSANILDSYKEKDKRICVISQENHGLGYSRNQGIDKASGSYLMFLDSDDMLAKGLVKNLAERAELDSLDWLCFDYLPTFESDEIKSAQSSLNRHHLYDYPGVCSGCELFSRMQETDDYFPMAWLGFFRRNWLSENNIRFPEGILHEDELFTFLCYLMGHRVGYLSEQGYIYRLRDNSIVTKPSGIKNVLGMYISANSMVSLCYDHREMLSRYRPFNDYALHLKAAAAYTYHHNEEIVRNQVSNDFERMMLDDLQGYGARELLDALYNSSSWKVGNKLIQPLHKLKKIMKSSIGWETRPDGR